MAQQEVDVQSVRITGRPILISGDGDFWGPPTFRCRFWLENRDQTIFLHLRARWEEPKPDWTVFEFETERPVADIRGQFGGDWYFVAFRDQYDIDLSAVEIPGIDQGLQQVYQSEEGAIREIRAEGDSYGGWFGGPDRPQLEVEFNRIYFTVSNDPRPV